MQKHVSITNCSRNDTISKCIEDFLDEQFMNCNTESFHSYSCPLKELFERSYAAMGLRIAGYQQVVNTTGCKLPCTRYGYELTPGKSITITNICIQRVTIPWWLQTLIGFRNVPPSYKNGQPAKTFPILYQPTNVRNHLGHCVE